MRFGIGVPLGRRVRFGWRPYVGVQYGSIAETGPGDPEGPEGADLFRVTGDLMTSVQFMDSDAINAAKVAEASATWRLWYLEGEDLGRNVLDLSLTFFMSKSFGVGIEYEIGRKPPLFGKEETFAVTAGVGVGCGG